MRKNFRGPRVSLLIAAALLSTAAVAADFGTSRCPSGAGAAAARGADSGTPMASAGWMASAISPMALMGVVPMAAVVR